MADCIIPSNTGGDSVNSGRIRVINFLLQKGLTPTQACAFCGNIQAESSFKSDITDGDKAHNMHSKGLAQWNGSRDTKLREFAASQGKDFTDFGLQLDFLWYELNTSKIEVLKHLRNNPNESLDECTTYICRNYENPSKIYEYLTKRCSYAKEALDLYNQLEKGECKVDATYRDTSNSSSSTPTSSSSWPVPVKTSGNFSLDCQKLFNGISALMGGSVTTIEQTINVDETGKTSVTTETVVTTSNKGKLLIIGDSWAVGISNIMNNKNIEHVSKAIGSSGVAKDVGTTLSAVTQLSYYDVDTNKPRCVLCHTGFNGMQNYTTEESFCRLIQKANGIDIFLVSMPFTKHTDSYLNNDDNVRKHNGYLESACNKYQNAHYVDLGDDVRKKIKESMAPNDFHPGYSNGINGYLLFYNSIISTIKDKYKYDIITGANV